MAHSNISNARRSLSLVLVVAAGILSACELKPSTGPTQSFDLAATRYRVSGIVTDETGSPIPMAQVEVDFFRGNATFSDPASICPSLQSCWLTKNTNSRGEFRVELDATQNPQFPGNIGYIAADAGEFETNVQLLPFGNADIAQVLRLRRIRAINAGESIGVSVEPDSSLCTDLEDMWALQFRAEVIRVVAESAGTLVIETQPTDAGRAAATLYWATSGNYAGVPVRTGPGALSIPVRGGTYSIYVATPVGSGTAAYTVKTSLQGQ